MGSGGILIPTGPPAADKANVAEPVIQVRNLVTGVPWGAQAPVHR